MSTGPARCRSKTKAFCLDLGKRSLYFPAHPHVLLLVMNKILKRLQHCQIHLVTTYPLLKRLSNEDGCGIQQHNNAQHTIQPLPGFREKLPASAHPVVITMARREIREPSVQTFPVVQHIGDVLYVSGVDSCRREFQNDQRCVSPIARDSARTPRS